MTPFRILVYAITAALLLWIFFVYFLPFFFPQQDPVELIGKSLGVAEIELGKGFSSGIKFPGQSAISTAAFNNSRRNVIFQCNSEECCPLDEECGGGIEWNSSRVSFKQPAYITVTARCEQQYGFFTCTVYFGEKPAQIEIKSITVQDTGELANKKPQVSMAMQNSGGVDLKAAVVEFKVFKKYAVGGREEEQMVQSASKTEEVGTIPKGESATRQFELDITDAGKYHVVAKAIAPEAGFDENSLEFDAEGNASGCRADGCAASQIIDGKCIRHCNCTNCVFGTECLNRLQRVVSELTNALSSNILGPNIVDFELPASKCA
ncbi:MAG: hypothetical protein NTW59_04345 [Candidatus Diapherotrites archaeon]|nr:hypothetical protein [Candidatus Diapherotrites archaeon]